MGALKVSQRNDGTSFESVFVSLTIGKALHAEQRNQVAVLLQQIIGVVHGRHDFRHDDDDANEGSR